MYKGSIGSLLLASLITGFIMLLNLWVLFGPLAASKLNADANLLTFFGSAATFAIAMAIAEQFILLSQRRQMWPSVLGGVFAFALTFVLWGGVATFQVARADHAASIVVLMVAVIGGLLGLVHFALGDARERRLPDDPQILAAALAEQAATPAEPVGPTEQPTAHRRPSAFGSLFGSATPQPGPATVEAGDRLYFAGPVQVRTSYGALFLSGALFGLLSILILFGLFVLGASLSPRPIEDVFGYWILFNRTALISWLIFGTLGTAALLFLPNLIAHSVARWMKVTSVGGYGGIGFLTAAILCVIVPPLGFIALLPCPLAMLLYRRIVGLEPVNLPSDLVVTDKDALIGADHPRRRYRRVLVQD